MSTYDWPHPGASYTNNLLIAIQMWWKIQFANPNFSNPIAAIFAHGATAMLSCVQKFVAISSPGMELEWNKFSIKFESWCIKHQWNRSLVLVGAIITHLTHWGREKMAAISQTTFSNAFSWMKMDEFRLKFHWSLFLRCQLTIFQHWFR